MKIAPYTGSKTKNKRAIGTIKNLMNIFKLDTRVKKSKPPIIDIYSTLNDFRKTHEGGTCNRNNILI